MRVLIGLLSELSHERRQERMAATLEAAGHEVSITWVDNGTAPLSAFWKGRRLHRLENPRDGRRKAYFARYMHWFHGLILRERPDCVLAVDPPALLPARLALARREFRLLYDAREYYCELPTIRERRWVRHFWNWGEGWGMRRAQASWAVCGSIARALERDHSVRDVGVVRNLPLRSFAPREPGRRAALRALVPELGDGPVVVYAGGFWPGYDFRPLQQAMGELPEAQLVCLGDGPELGRHQRHAAQQSWSQRLHFPGKVAPERLEGLLRGADAGVVLVPDLGLSYRYLLPNKLFEYIQAGLPVLASPLPELASVVLGRHVGRCAEPADAAAIATRLRELLDPVSEPRWQEALAAAAGELCWEREEARFLRLAEGDGSLG